MSTTHATARRSGNAAAPRRRTVSAAAPVCRVYDRTATTMANDAMTILRTVAWLTLFVALLTGRPAADAGIRPGVAPRRMAHGHPAPDRARARSGDPSGSHRAGLRRPRVQVARRFRGPYLDRGQARRRRPLHALRSHRLERAARRQRGVGLRFPGARRRVVRRGAAPGPRGSRRHRRNRHRRGCRQAVASYPYPDTYTAWPGPNSNTFIAHLGREIPALRLTLPPLAIGKDFLPDGGIVARTPSGTGVQLSLGGVLGVLAGRDEGFELNVLGLVTGIRSRASGAQAAGHRSDSRRREPAGDGDGRATRDGRSPAPPERRGAAERFGPWHPGIDSQVPSRLRHR